MSPSILMPMAIANPNTELAILTRVVAPDQSGLPAEVARAFLTPVFVDDDSDRMNTLAARARESTLSADEQAELDLYERIGYLLSLLHSRARLSLRTSSAAS